MVVFMTSTLGYEAIARNKKVLGFCCKGTPNFQKKNFQERLLGLFLVIKKRFFWVNDLNLKIFSKNLIAYKNYKNKWNKKKFQNIKKISWYNYIILN